MPTEAPTAQLVQIPSASPTRPTLASPSATPLPPQPTSTHTPTVSPSPTSSPTPSRTFTPTGTATLIPVDYVPTPTPWPRPQLLLTPGEPQPYLERYRLIAYYGSPPGPALGILGAAPRPQIVEQLRELARQYQRLAPERYALPTFHIITTIADPIAGRSGNYSHWLNSEILEEWLTAAEAEELAVVLDIQPGYADLQSEFERLKPYLYRPHVHLALDSEFTMEGGAIPGLSLGHLHGEQINLIQAELNRIALEIGINKVLIVHQFDSSMVLEKETIVDYPHVELVIDADGFGAPEGKTADYVQYAAEPGLEYGGFKLFYDWDFPLMSPPQVMEIEPRPAIVIYQ